MGLYIVPLALSQANQFVENHHRHHHSIPVCKFCLGATVNGKLVGVAMVGLPLSRNLMDGETLEVRRTCTDGTRNANSKLYGAAWAATRALGYHRLITYTLPEESGSSLLAVGWNVTGMSSGGSWHTPGSNRHRLSRHPQGKKLRWEITDSQYMKNPKVVFEKDSGLDNQIYFFTQEIKESAWAKGE